MRFLFLLGSSRRGGNTELLARRAADALPASVEQRWLRLDEHPLAPFADIRHAGDGRYPEPTGNEALLLAETLAATDLVIASPLYWYNVSAATKLYLDHWAGWLRIPGTDFRDRMRGRTLWAVSAISDEESAKADPLVASLRLSAEYLGMRWGGSLLGYANRPGDVLRDATALRAAATFFNQPALGDRLAHKPLPVASLRA
ncbi:flavodoxin family protein [Micromonospora globispora]|nr:NAD(P)H-dependent oxidoreductase [Micromonospora globispora]